MVLATLSRTLNRIFAVPKIGALFWLLAAAPLAWLIYAAATNNLGADPAKTIVLFTGEWCFYLLLITLSVTPLRQTLKLKGIHKHRRMLGLWALTYALCHLLSFYLFILGGDLSFLAQEIAERPYILIGLPALILFIALGVTSPKWVMRKLGKYWRPLHQSIYLIALLAWVHVLLQVRSSYYDAVIYGAAVAALLGYRIWHQFAKTGQHQKQNSAVTNAN